MGNWIRSCSIVAAALMASVVSARQAPSSPQLPYAAVHNPEFISAGAATFMGGDDRVIGVMVGTTPKAYPAGILSQHGLVEDLSPSGPIAITW